MSTSSLENSTYEIRGDLKDAHKEAWARIAAPGTWLTGEARVAVAAEIRQARECTFCTEIKNALSPNAVQGTHTSTGTLSAAEVELIHRVTSDSGRLSEPWSRSVLDMGLSAGEFVEIVGIIAMVMVLDTCTFGLGLPDTDLPQPQAGEPTHYLPPGAKRKPPGCRSSNRGTRLRKMDRCIRAQRPAISIAAFPRCRNRCATIGQWLIFITCRANTSISSISPSVPSNARRWS